MVKLKNESYLLRSHRREFFFTETTGFNSVDNDFPFGRLIEGSQNIQKRAFPAS